MGNISQVERERRLALEAIGNADNIPNETRREEVKKAAIEKYNELLEHFNLNDPTRLPPTDPTDDFVMVRVLPRGDGKVSMGVYNKTTNSFPFHKRGDRFPLDRTIALAQEENGYVEILEEPVENGS